MANAQDQLRALRELACLYSHAKLWGRPRRFEYYGADVELRSEQRMQLQREMAHAHMELSLRVREAQKQLLSAGYPLPDSWLTVRVVGRLSCRHTAATEEKPEKAVLADSGADLKALETMCREVAVALLRLESQTEISPHDEDPSTTRSPMEQRDLPVTLRDFIKIYCESGDKLSDARLDSIRNSLQNAARRKGSGVVLPKQVGEWRRGQKKYHKPSQLSRAWPSFVKALSYLPPLKQVKS